MTKSLCGVARYSRCPQYRRTRRNQDGVSSRSCLVPQPLSPRPRRRVGREFVEDRRAFARKTDGPFQIDPQLRDLPFQPVERRLPHGEGECRRRLLAGLLLPPVPCRAGNARRKPRLLGLEASRPAPAAPARSAAGLSRGAQRRGLPVCGYGCHRQLASGYRDRPSSGSRPLSLSCCSPCSRASRVSSARIFSRSL